jgi:hypothetical protein
LRAEARDRAAEWAIAEQDQIEARGGSTFDRFGSSDDDDIPFSTDVPPDCLYDVGTFR